MLSLQVFVFSRTAYSMIKERLKSKGVADITAKELEGYFSPWHAKHIGQIKVTFHLKDWPLPKLCESFFFNSILFLDMVSFCQYHPIFHANFLNH